MIKTLTLTIVFKIFLPSPRLQGEKTLNFQFLLTSKCTVKPRLNSNPYKVASNQSPSVGFSIRQLRDSQVGIHVRAFSGCDASAKDIQLDPVSARELALLHYCPLMTAAQE